MAGLRHFLSFARPGALMGFVIAALGMEAFVPAGLMVAPASGFGAQIILCPQTHPLARAAAAQASAELAAMPLAIGHARTDHAAMVHAPAPDDDPDPARSAAANAPSCAFAGAGALAGLLPDQPAALAPLASGAAAHAQLLRPLQIASAARLRPPVRAPPLLI